MRKIYLLSILAMLLVLLMPAHAQSDLPYNYPPNPTNCLSDWTDLNGGFGGEKAVGVQDTLFAGRTLSSISFYLCTLSTNNVGSFTNVCPLVTTSTATIGILSLTTGAVIQSFGTVALSSLPCALASNRAAQTSLKVTVTGNHVMQANEMVGVTFSAVSNVTSVMVASNSALILSTGGIIDCVPSCTNTAGNALAGVLTISGFPGVPPSTQGSSILPAVFAIMMVGIYYGFSKSPTDGETKLKLSVAATIGMGIVFLALIAGGI